MTVAVPSREEGAVVPSPVTEAEAAALPADDVLARLGSGTGGLAEAEAARGLRVTGPNAVRSHRVRELSVLASQLRSAGPDGAAGDKPLLLGLLCNEAVVEGGRVAGGNPLDAALWDSPAAAGQRAAGNRVVAVATREAPGQSWLTPADGHGLTFRGILVFLDPPKPDARAALERLAGLGVSVKILTGDNPVVAAKVCADLGLPPGQVATGADIGAAGDQLGDLLARTTVSARVSPEHKAQVVRAQRATGADVAFLGDGVNDAIALHAADVGISVESATDAAKDAADVLLLEKDLGKHWFYRSYPAPAAPAPRHRRRGYRVRRRAARFTTRTVRPARRPGSSRPARPPSPSKGVL